MQYHINKPDTVISGKTYTGSLSAYEMHPDGKPYHTFRTATVYVEGARTHFVHCLFENTAGPGDTVGQAIALHADADDLVFEDCVFRGSQDTLFLAPLPPTEYEPDGFLGPGRDQPRTPRVMRFIRCRIEGSVDFIFGGATAFFDSCEFVSTAPGYVFAPCTPAHVTEGFVAVNCRFTSSADVPPRSCFIARPWRDYGAVCIENCELGSHISPQGWDDWGKTDAHGKIRFIEIESTGPGAVGERPEWVTVIRG